MERERFESKPRTTERTKEDENISGISRRQDDDRLRQ
jgi:hypothetical protein